MKLHAPNFWLFIVAAILAIVGMSEYLWDTLAIAGLSSAHAVWLIFLAWFLLAIGTALPERT